MEKVREASFEFIVLSTLFLVELHLCHLIESRFQLKVIDYSIFGSPQRYTSEEFPQSGECFLRIRPQWSRNV